MRTSRYRRARWRAGVSVTAVMAAAVALVAWMLAPTTAGAAVGAGTYTLTNAGSGLCLNLPGSSTTAGVQLQQTACNGGNDQKWTLTAVSGGFTIRSVTSGLCVGVRSAATDAGKPIEQQSCNGSATQTWTMTASGSNYRVVNSNGGKCANIKDNSTASGALVQTNSCDSVATKQWTFTTTGGGGSPSPTPTRTTPTPTPTVTSTPPPNTGLIGWATQNGGTTGGGTASPITVTSLDQLNSAVSGDGAAVIRVNGNFTCSADVRVGSNKTILGVGSGSGLTGCGFNMRDVHNVILRNLRISKVLAGNGNGDAIHIDGATNIWVDHNDLSSDLSHDIDFYDGLLDITHAADFITVSWNILHDHYKCSLVGHSDSNASEDTGHLRVTYHHNAFNNCYERGPRVRFGNPVHVFNNYYVMGGGPDHYHYSIASTENAGVRVEGNYFENQSDPTHLGEGDSDPGSIVASNNVLVNSGPILTAGSVASIPYAYSVTDPNSVKSAVTSGAGTGKIGT